MANADFSRQPNTTGGFDASSYRAAKPAEAEVQLTPFQQKLAGLEKALPAALSRQAVAVILSIVVMLGCFVGFGGMGGGSGFGGAGRSGGSFGGMGGGSSHGGGAGRGR